MVEMKMIAANSNGEEIGFAKEIKEIDIEIGKENDFEAIIDAQSWSEEKYGYENRLFIPNTEWGGIIEDIEGSSISETVKIRGKTWRGLLNQKIIEPPQNQNNLILNGDLNDCIKTLLGDSFEELYVVEKEKSGITVSGWIVDRYVTLYQAITKLLNFKKHKLNLQYVEPQDERTGYVKLKAEEIHDYSDRYEYSRESRVEIKARDFRGGINHLICAGKGQNEERTILHLYVQKDGSIGKTKVFSGKNERVAVYEYTSAEPDKLEEGGIKRLQELQNYKKAEIAIHDGEFELEDIVGGFEEITKTSVKQPIESKVLKLKDGDFEISYKVKGGS